MEKRIDLLEYASCNTFLGRITRDFSNEEKFVFNHIVEQLDQIEQYPKKRKQKIVDLFTIMKKTDIFNNIKYEVALLVLHRVYMQACDTFKEILNTHIFKIIESK